MLSTAAHRIPAYSNNPSLFPLPASSFYLPDSNGTTGSWPTCIFDSGSATLAVLVTSGPAIACFTSSPAAAFWSLAWSTPPNTGVAFPSSFNLCSSCFLVFFFLAFFFFGFIRFKSFLKGLGCFSRAPPSPPACIVTTLATTSRHSGRLRHSKLSKISKRSIADRRSKTKRVQSVVGGGNGERPAGRKDGEGVVAACPSVGAAPRVGEGGVQGPGRKDRRPWGMRGGRSPVRFVRRLLSLLSLSLLLSTHPLPLLRPDSLSLLVNLHSKVHRSALLRRGVRPPGRCRPQPCFYNTPGGTGDQNV